MDKRDAMIIQQTFDFDAGLWGGASLGDKSIGSKHSVDRQKASMHVRTMYRVQKHDDPSWN